MRSPRLALAASLAALTLALGTAAPSAVQAGPSSLTLFHNNDGESTILGSNGFGGFALFLNELESARNTAIANARDVLTVSSGDNFLAGIAFEASQNRRAQGIATGQGYGADNKAFNYYDAMALATADYDAITLGNHDFDFGPDVLADFIGGYQAVGGDATFITANLDFSGDANLAGLATSGVIASRTVVTGASGEQYGIIGATTARLDTISSPGADIVIDADLVAVIQAEIDALEAAGVNRIILSSHLQSLGNEIDLIGQLRGIDVVVAGGGDELLANAADNLTSNPFQPNIEGPYPTTATNLDGATVPIVTTVGEYRYVGALAVEFDANGVVTGFGGDPILVEPGVSTPATGTRTPGGGGTAIDIAADIIAPLTADYASIEAQVVGNTDVNLDGLRANIRTRETNLGNLIADGFVFAATALGGLDPNAGGIIAMTNGGGIRASIDVGDITNGEVITVLPFANSLVVLNGFKVQDLVDTLTNAVSQLPNQDGRFLQISGFRFEYHQDTNEILNIYLDDGTHLYSAYAGVLVGPDFTLDVITNSFTAAGGDDHDALARYLATDLGISYAEALRVYLRDGLGGEVRSLLAYAGAEGRIMPAPIPATAALVLLGLGAVRVLRRRG